MPMTRDDALAYLASKFSVLLTDAAITPDEDGLGAVIDDALLLTGVGYADLGSATVADAGVVGFRAVLAYVTLQACLDAVVNRVTTSKSLASPSVSKSESRNQIVDSLTKRLALAKAAAEPFITASGESAFSTGTVSLGAFGTECAAW